MDGHVTVRFQEFERYDIECDAMVITFMATTNLGSYWCETELGGAKSLRERRNEFKEAAIDMIQREVAPCELSFSNEA